MTPERAAPWDIRLIVLDPEIASSPMAARAAERLPGAPVVVLDSGQSPADRPEVANAGGHVLYLKNYKGRFLRPCPGTRRYLCCGYRIVHIGENCPMDCSYCILKAYFRDRVLKVWANQADQFRELAQAFDAEPGRRFRVGTGEFADSLALEPVTGHSRDLLTFLAGRDNVVVELKSKTADLSWLPAVSRPDRVLAAWSVNAPEICAAEELGTAALAERLAAAATCAEAGVGVCLHFDPIIHFPGWEKGYAQTIEMIGDVLRPKDLVYVSLGSFRYLPELAGRMEERGRTPAYMYGEFVLGLDGKRRLLRPLRTAQLRFVARGLARLGLARKTYLCMESRETWKSVFGTAPAALAAPGGLAAHLSDMAFDRRG